MGLNLGYGVYIYCNSSEEIVRNGTISRSDVGRTTMNLQDSPVYLCILYIKRTLHDLRTEPKL